jgi:putative Mg2+ transporter-C (MgtC) family protein
MTAPTSILDQLSVLELTPIALAILIGGVIGFEREIHGRPAGLRTHILVCLTSTMLIYASRTLPVEYLGLGENTRIVLDPNRLGAGIVTGIGFLGAATVIRAGDIVRGITTGATVWSVAGLGVVIGQGEYGLAITGAAAVIGVLAGLNRLARKIAPVIYRHVRVRGLRAEQGALSKSIAEILESHDIRVQDLSGTRGNADEPFELVFHIRCRNLMQAPQMLELVAAQKGVLAVEWSQITSERLHDQ